MSEPHDSAVEELALDECWDLLTLHDFGRLAVATDTGVDIFPMNYLVHDRAIFLRSAPGSKLTSITERPAIAFEVDGRRLRRRWSIVVKGNIDRLGFDSEIVESGILELNSQSPTAKWNYLRISPESVTGRRFKAPRR
ncbi:MAG: pyridoxamine 5'-phosphate oxidase family protein [Microbacteriaceae bacterium]|nr:pyridoxamine 5'-phosphate oxidase family protein [Microbacteriaceae bacterium]